MPSQISFKFDLLLFYFHPAPRRSALSTLQRNSFVVSVLAGAIRDRRIWNSPDRKDDVNSEGVEYSVHPLVFVESIL